MSFVSVINSTRCVSPQLSSEQRVVVHRGWVSRSLGLALPGQPFAVSCRATLETPPWEALLSPHLALI
jgi:hypothetical protein